MSDDRREPGDEGPKTPERVRGLGSLPKITLGDLPPARPGGRPVAPRSPLGPPAGHQQATVPPPPSTTLLSAPEHDSTPPSGSTAPPLPPLHKASGGKTLVGVAPPANPP